MPPAQIHHPQRELGTADRQGELASFPIASPGPIFPLPARTVLRLADSNAGSFASGCWLTLALAREHRDRKEKSSDGHPRPSLQGTPGWRWLSTEGLCSVFQQYLVLQAPTTAISILWPF